MLREQLLGLARTVEPFVVEARRYLHQHPELSFQEAETAAYVAARLREWGYEPVTGIAGMHGVTAVLEGGRHGPTIALRADMDALPIHEETGLPFASTRAGVMHACGHDCHTAILLGTAKLFASLKEQIPGRVIFIFQPAEEVLPGGAKAMVEAGVVDRVDRVFGLHIAPNTDAGKFGFQQGVAMANTDNFRITVRGKGGHGAYPHTTVDPVVIAAQCITALQQIVSRQVSPMHAAVITVGIVQGGTQENIIPDSVELRGTVRTLDAAVRDAMPGRMERLVKGIAEGLGGSADFAYTFGYPALVNDDAALSAARRAAEAVVGSESVSIIPTFMGGEDFAYFTRVKPGCFGWIGVADPKVESGKRYPAHNGRMMVDESALYLGVAYYTALVTEA